MKELNTNTELKVIMNNALVQSKSDLSLNETKFLRIVIMQILKDDTDLLTYRVPITELAEMLDVTSDNLYRNIKNKCKNLLKAVVEIDTGNEWEMFQWVSKCSYRDGIITIRLHDDLKPYLLGLRGYYTQYLLSDILSLQSIHAVRIYELIREKLRSPLPFGHQIKTIHLDIDEIRDVTNTNGKYDRYSSFKTKVIDKTQSEINSRLTIHVEFKPTKRGRKIIGYDVEIMSLAKWLCVKKEREKTENK